MNKYLISIITVIICLSNTSCEKEDILTPKGSDYLYLFPDEITCIPNVNCNIFFNECIPGVDFLDKNDSNFLTYSVTAISDSINTFWDYDQEAISIRPTIQDLGEHNLKISIYDPMEQLIAEKQFILKIISPNSDPISKNILILGDSWTEINSNSGEGYVYYINECFKNTKYISPIFIGTNATNNGIHHEGRGGYMARTWCDSPNNERKNPLWNIETKNIDFTHYREKLCKVDTHFDLVNIQLGVNECVRTSKCSTSDIKRHVKAFISLTEAILRDSPLCKVIIQPCGLDAESKDAFASLDNGIFSKEIYQTNLYRLREELYNQLSQRADFKKQVFWGQAVFGLDRKRNYANAIHPNTIGYKEMGYMAVPQMIDLLTSE